MMAGSAVHRVLQVVLALFLVFVFHLLNTQH
jgi:hypothetical protein